MKMSGWKVSAVCRMIDWREQDWAEKRAAFQRDGVVHVPGLLDREQLAATLKAWGWSLANPTPTNAPLLKRNGG